MDKVEVVHWDGRVVAIAVVVDGEEAVVREEEAVVKRYLLTILMLIWRSIMQKQCRKIEIFFCFLLIGFYVR